MDLRVAFIFAISVSLNSVRGYGPWVDQPYDDVDAYNTNAEYLSNVTLDCADIGPTDVIDYWILPDMRVFVEGDFDEFRTLDGTSRWRVANGKMEITMVQEQHFGFYTCRYTTSSATKRAVKRSLNVRGAYFGDLWETYRMPTIIGLSAAGGFLVISISLCVIYHYKAYGPKQRKEDEEEERNNLQVVSVNEGPQQHTENGRMNNAFDADQGQKDEATPL